MNQYLELGQIVNVKGLKGEVKVNSFSENNERFEEVSEVILKLKSKQETYKIEKVGYHKSQVIIKFKNVNTVEEAEKLRNAIILIDRDVLGELPEGVYYIADLIGLDVYTEENEHLGKVDDIYNTGSNDIYVVKNDLGKQILLPAIKEVVKEINLDEKTITVHILKGLMWWRKRWSLTF